MRIQVTLDDVLGKELQSKAEELGFSVSSYARYLIKNAISRPNVVDRALAEESESISFEDFKKQLGVWYVGATSKAFLQEATEKI